MKKYLFTLLAVLSLCVVVGLLFSSLNARSPVYRGKTVKAWLGQLSALDPKARAEAEAALKALGTNAVPELARLLRAKDARWRQLLWSRKIPMPRRLRGLVLQRVDPPTAYLIHPAAARVLAQLGPGAAAAQPDLVRALQDKVNGTYWEAGAALGRIGEAAVPDLIRALEDPHALVRSAAAHGLGEAGPAAAAAVPALIRVLRAGSTNEQQIAAQSLAQIGTPAVAALVSLLVHEGGPGGEAAAGVLLRHYDQFRPTPPAGGNPMTDDSAVRAQAIAALGASSLPDELVARLLAGAVKDPALGVRLAALKALAQPQRTLPPAPLALSGLIAGLKDPSPAIRECAARVLGRIGSEGRPAVPALTRLGQDEDEAVRGAAQAALEAIRGGGTNNAPRQPPAG